jgi:hypothetical protein
MTTRHLVASWGDSRGARHTLCTCGAGTPPTGAQTRETAEVFVRGCRAAQDPGDRRDGDHATPASAGPEAAQDGPADPGAGATTGGAAQAVSGPRP